MGYTLHTQRSSRASTLRKLIYKSPKWVHGAHRRLAASFKTVKKISYRLQNVNKEAIAEALKKIT